MDLDYNINIYEIDTNDSSKTLVTFLITDKSTEKVLLVSKRITTGSKTREEILEEAYSESLQDVDEWKET